MGFCSVGKRKISLPFCTRLQQAAISNAANFNTCLGTPTGMFERAQALSLSLWLILSLAVSETIHLQPSLLIMIGCTDHQMAPAPSSRWLSLSVCIIMTQVDEIIWARLRQASPVQGCRIKTNNCWLLRPGKEMKKKPKMLSASVLVSRQLDAGHRKGEGLSSGARQY